ncbi:MAG: 50S ribosomal protein L23 [Thermodesulfobacteriota bacterium]
MTELYKIIKKPLITEKSTMLRGEANQVALWVDAKANKCEIKKAVEKAFDVKVVGVNSLKVPGKKRRMGRSEGRTSMRKKVYVTLKEGETIELFEGV